MVTTREGVPAGYQPTNGLASTICRTGLAIDGSSLWSAACVGGFLRVVSPLRQPPV